MFIDFEMNDGMTSSSIDSGGDDSSAFGPCRFEALRLAELLSQECTFVYKLVQPVVPGTLNAVFLALRTFRALPVALGYGLEGMTFEGQ